MYNNIITVTTQDDGSIVVRRGEADDWAAYRLPDGVSPQSGSLSKISPRARVFPVIEALVEVYYPGLRYRP